MIAKVLGRAFYFSFFFFFSSSSSFLLLFLLLLFFFFFFFFFSSSFSSSSFLLLLFFFFFFHFFFFFFSKNLFSYFSTKTYVVGTQKNRLIKTVLLSTQNICSPSSFLLSPSSSSPNNYFLISQPKHMLWVLKRTVSTIIWKYLPVNP